MMVLMFFTAWFSLSAVAAPLPTEVNPIRDLAHKKGKSEEEAEELSEAEAEEERRRKEKLARVIVLKWPETSTDYSDENVQREVRSRTGRPDAMFFPEVDLYQNGRKVRDRTVIPAQQPALVPDSAIPQVMAVVEEVSGIPWNGMAPDQWGLKAQEMRALSESLWFIDRVELREPLFLLYAQMGRAAENQNHSAPPFYEEIGTYAVNYYWYLAATLAYQEPGLMSKLTDQELSGSIGYYLQNLQQGTYPTLKVDFEQENIYDEEEFNATYEVYLNGLPVELDSNAQTDVFLGRTDIYLKRKDSGHGLSERLEVTKLKDRIYFVRDVARKRMGVDFIDQLFLHKNECSPEVDGDILNYLAIYAKLHSKAEIYIAVPETGNANKMWIWRYDRSTAQLNRVAGGGDGFPVRFAFLFSSGALYSGASIAAPDFENTTSLAPDELAADSQVDLELADAALPFNFELRMHYNRLMVNFGSEFGYNTADGEGWIEYYQTPGQQEDENIQTVDVSTCAFDNGTTCEQAYNVRTFNRDLYLGAGVVLGPDAGIGFGPRFAARWGWNNIPHGWQTTAHFGWAFQPPIFGAAGRVRPLIDLDARAGVTIDRDRSFRQDYLDDASPAALLFGLTAGVGLTF